MFGFKTRKQRKASPPCRRPLAAAECLENRRVLASISGNVYHDVDANGYFYGNDQALAGIVVSLDGVDNRGNQVQLSQSTDATGGYSFTDLPRGTYTLSAGQSANHIDGATTSGTEGGTASSNTINDISLRRNDDATGYLFGKWDASALSGHVYKDLDRDGNFDAGDSPLSGIHVNLTGTDDLGASVSTQLQTASDGSYRFDGLRPGTYELSAATPAGLTDGRETLGRFDGNSHAVPENGNMLNDRFESIQVGAGQSGRNYNFGEFDDGVASGVLATTFESTLVFDGTSGDDVFEFIGGENEHTIILNGQSQQINATETTQIIFYAHGGTDSAELTGGPGVDQAELRETSAKLTGTSYQVLVYTTNNTTVQSGGGEDRALFYDTIGDDTFYADPLGATLSGDDYKHAANDFHRVYAYTSEGQDTARLVGSDGDDRFIATPTDARMYGTGYYNYTRGFYEVHGTAGDGTDDRAYFYDSAEREIFDAKGNESRFYGAAFDNYAHGFDRTYAFSSGNDYAIFRDSGLSDYYKVDDNGARMYGDGYYNRAVGFRVHYAYFDASDNEVDRVAFHDSSSDDYFIAYNNYFYGYRNGTVHYVTNPDIVLAEATVGTDRAGIRTTYYELRTEGDWDPWYISFGISTSSRVITQ